MNMAAVAIGCVSLYFLGQYLYCRQESNCVGIASGRINLPYCYCI